MINRCNEVPNQSRQIFPDVEHFFIQKWTEGFILISSIHLTVISLLKKR